MWVMYPGASGEPDPGNLQTFATELGAIVDLKVGPDGDVFYIDIRLGELRRISYSGGTPRLPSSTPMITRETWATTLDKSSAG
jgi:hypothetical protein